MLRQLLERFRERKRIMQEADDNYRINHTLEQRRKSSDEREVEEFMEQKRQEQIKEQARQIRAMKNSEAWKGKTNILKAPNIFTNEQSILKDNYEMSIFRRSNFI